ncbi:MAG: hypothetical protein IPN53_08535 [Comamonadaceae bacterium]|nr:hypothetical protein [Comamonadaceae bacterium]
MATLRLTLLLLLLVLAGHAGAEPVVVVNASNVTQQLSHDQVINIFLGRYRSLPSGGVAVPIDQPESSALKTEFYRKLVNKEPNELNAYWSRLIFSGKTLPPLQTTSSSDVVALLINNPGAIAYMERGLVDKRFRIVMEFQR